MKPDRRRRHPDVAPAGEDGTSALVRWLGATALVLTLAWAGGIPLRAQDGAGPAAGDGGLPYAEIAERAAALEAVQATARDVVAVLERLSTPLAALLDRLNASDFPDEELLVAAIELLYPDSLGSGPIDSDSRRLAYAVDRAFARGPAAFPALGDDARLYAASRAELEPASRELLARASEVEALDRFREELAAHIARLRKEAEPEPPGPAPVPAIVRLEALERESEWHLADERAALQRLIEAARSYQAITRRLRGLTCGLVETLAPELAERCGIAAEADVALAALAIATPIFQSVYDFFSDEAPEKDGFGLYTYVLFPIEDSRNAALLEALTDSTPPAGFETAAEREHLNVFYIPVRDSGAARAIADDGRRLAGRDVYAYPLARSLLIKLCDAPADDRPSICGGAPWRGPYLLTHPEPLSGRDAIARPYLLVDLGPVHEGAFGEFVRAVKEQVMRPDFTDRAKIDTLRLALLNITLKTADWVNPISEGVAGLMFLGKGAD